MAPRLLHIGIFNDKEPQWSLRNALKEISSVYIEYDWQTIRHQVNQIILQHSNNVDVIFLQLQCGGVVSPSVLETVKHKVKIFNFTGDVRQPLPKWYIDLAPHCTTLFTNNTDVEYLQSLGHKAVYFQIGYNSEFYTYMGDRYLVAPDIVFMGNHYPGAFPLSQFRYDMVTFLQKEYGERFRVYGKGYPGAIDLNYKQREEANVYRSASIGINCSHFNLKQYSSDRMLRIMACGCFCLSHRFEDIDKEFSEGIHLRSWQTLEELKILIDYYLDNHNERNKIAAAGMDLVRTQYTWDYRIRNQFLQLINEKNATEL
jgi:glycosyltransferase involved in cell wall biosynthesis